MMNYVFFAGQLRRVLCVVLTATAAMASSVSTRAQNPAAMSVLRGVQGGQVGQSPEGPENFQPQPQPSTGPGQPPSTAPATASGNIDTRYIAPNSALVIVMRPAQLLSTPIGQLLPGELAAAYLGFEATEIDEIVAFVDPSSPAGLGYGVTLKFKNPVRATSIPVERRSHVQLAELNGKKYLKSVSPIGYSLYGPNNKTLIAATDASLRQLVETAGQPKSGPMIERLQSAPAGNDLYIAANAASVKQLIPMLAGGDAAKLPPQVQPLLAAIDQLSAAEFTLNVSNPGPTSLVLHCANEATPQQIEMLLQMVKQQLSSNTQTPTAQALARYRERLWQPFLQPQRNGAAITFRIDGQSPAHQQLVSSATVLIAAAADLIPTALSARNAFMQGQPPGLPGAQPVVPGQPGSPEGNQPGTPPTPGQPGSPEPERR